MGKDGKALCENGLDWYTAWVIGVHKHYRKAHWLLIKVM